MTDIAIFKKRLAAFQDLRVEASPQGRVLETEMNGSLVEAIASEIAETQLARTLVLSNEDGNSLAVDVEKGMISAASQDVATDISAQLIALCKTSLTISVKSASPANGIDNSVALFKFDYVQPNRMAALVESCAGKAGAFTHTKADCVLDSGGDAANLIALAKRELAEVDPNALSCAIFTAFSNNDAILFCGRLGDEMVIIKTSLDALDDFVKIWSQI